MSANSKIEWTDHTFNPWEGCQKVGPGCDNCYAETRNARYAGGQAVNWGPGAPRRRTSAANWHKPLVWNAAHDAFFQDHGRRQRVFCASLADVFDNAVDQRWRDDLFTLIEATPNLDWLLLTKRIGNMQHQVWPRWMHQTFPPNIWLGGTVVNQAEADRDIPKLLALPARVRFLSMEPLLGAVDLRFPTRVCGGDRCAHCCNGDLDPTQYDRKDCPHCRGTRKQKVLDWVIVGGESGSGARPVHPGWARSLRDQCAAAGVPFLFKQWGDWTPQDPGEVSRESAFADTLPLADTHAVPISHNPCFDCSERMRAARNVLLDGRTLMHRVGKKAAGRLLDGIQHDGFPALAD